MPEFRFSMRIQNIDMVGYVEIPDKELTPPTILGKMNKAFCRLYRKNAIQTRINAWALSKLKLSWEEVKQNVEGDSDQPHTTAKEQQA